MDDKNVTPETEQEEIAHRPIRRAMRNPDALFEKEEGAAKEAEAPSTPTKAEEAKDEAEPEEKKESTVPSSPSPEKDEENPRETEEPLSSAAAAFDWIKSFLISLAVVIFVFTLIFRGVTVDGDSMLPTLHDREYLIISDLFYTPECGDIVVAQAPHYKNGTEPVIKRVIAVGGQTVELNFNTWEIKVDGVLLNEPYILQDLGSMNAESLVPDENGIAQVQVKENCVFLMGDNRNNSLDSRSDQIGQIDERYIMGRVLLRISPLDRFGKVE